MSGAPGAGKSTLARMLRMSLGGVVIDHDMMRSQLYKFDAFGLTEAAEVSYGIQWALAEDMAAQGLTVIVDSPCNFPQVLEAGAGIAAKHSMEYWYVECRVDDMDIIEARLRARARVALGSQRTSLDEAPGNGDDNDPRGTVVKWIKHPQRPKENIIVVDTTGDPEIYCEQILKQLRGESARE